LKPTERLSYYAKFFDTVEVNSSFYSLPREESFKAWGDQTPEGFRFCIKGSRYVTHHLLPEGKRLRGVRKAVSNLTRRAKHLGDKLGPFLWQLPPTLKADADLLEKFLVILTSDGLDHVVEFRHGSWYSPEVFDLMESYRVGMCSVSAPWYSSELFRTSPVGYLRMHGETELYSGSYTTEELSIWATRLCDSFERSPRIGPKTEKGFVFFNNTNGNAVRNALALKRFIADPALRQRAIERAQARIRPKCRGCPERRRRSVCRVCNLFGSPSEMVEFAETHPEVLVNNRINLREARRRHLLPQEHGSRFGTSRKEG